MSKNKAMKLHTQDLYRHLATYKAATTTAKTTDEAVKAFQSDAVGKLAEFANEMAQSELAVSLARLEELSGAIDNGNEAEIRRDGGVTVIAALVHKAMTSLTDFPSDAKNAKGVAEEVRIWAEETVRSIEELAKLYGFKSAFKEICRREHKGNEWEGPNTMTNQRAKDSWDEIIARGWHPKKTSGAGLMCGIFALEKSLKYHNEHEGRNDHPSADDLMKLMSNKEYKDQGKLFAQSGQAKHFEKGSNLSAEQIGMILRLHGQSAKENLQLGVAYCQDGAVLGHLMSFDQEGADYKVIWIWNNNAQDDGSGLLGHWSGMGPQKRKRGAENSPEGDEGEKGKKKGKKRHEGKIKGGQNTKGMEEKETDKKEGWGKMGMEKKGGRGKNGGR